jgi:hypothetical protein
MEDLLRLAVPLILATLAALGLLSSFLFNVSGTWERIQDEDDATPHPPGPPERLTLGQFGPFVRGRRDVPGGFQEYAGTMWGPKLTLLRRDHGVQALVRANFPEVLAQKLSGDVFAELRLNLEDAGTRLSGTFKPQKIDFLLAPPRITSRYWMVPVPRAYRRVSPVEVEEEEQEPAVLPVEATSGPKPA